MISMTGYGQSKAVRDGEEIRISINSVNNRYCETIIKTPHRFVPLHSLIKKEVSSLIGRGKIFINLEYYDFRETKNDLRLDEGLLKNYLDILEKISLNVNGNKNIPLELPAKYPGIIVSFEENPEKSDYWDWICGILRDSVKKHQENCCDEGKNTQTEIISRLDNISEITGGILFSQEDLKKQYYLKIQKRLEDLPVKFQVDENRLYTEIALIIDRYDISEELVRLKSHIQKMREIIASKELTIGKKLDFYCQELYREINTLGSKIDCSETIGKVVDVKNEIEKIREQLQNIV